MPPVRILIVEDEVVVAMEIRRKLEAIGYTVAGIVGTGEEAIVSAGQTRPDFVLMDIKLAGKMDGTEAARRIHELYDVPVVYLTAHSDEKTLQKAKLAEPFGYLVKPFSEADLRTTVEVALYKHQQDSRIRRAAQTFSTTLSIMGGAVILADKSGMVEDLNSVAQTLTGWSREEASGRHVTEVCALQDQEGGERVDVLSSAQMRPGFVSAPGSYTLISKEGAEVRVQSRVIPVSSPQGEITGFILSFQDVTEEAWGDQDWFSYAANLCLSADMCRSRGDYAEAESLYKRAMLTLVKNLGTDHPRVAHVMRELAKVFQEMGKKNPSLTLQRMAAAVSPKE
jgi:PAS domain S-box-containing protein